ncbi:glycosyltransferase [Halomonas alkalisoli]|uniref:glycosyltransferase n=1 Tax=Halomonas alkalisoli TaxID=2907158 RepID=UPI001F19FF99|nr:glycosyltransferase [Halomonas alkalisoli]MCE9684323.1 glycosyltransferase [Halomonas alkalisoli]
MEHDAISMALNIDKYLANCWLVVRKGTWLERQGGRAGAKVIAINFSGSFSVSAIVRMRKLWREQQIKNIIFLGSSEIKSIHFSLTTGVEKFIVRHGTTKSSPKKDFVRRLTWSKVTAHWCISQHLEKNVRSLFPVGDAEVFVNYVALGSKLNEIPHAKQLTARSDSFELVHVGRLVQGKGQRDVLSAAKRLRDHGIPVHVSLYGDGDDNQYLVDLAKQLGIEECVRFMGYVDSPFSHFDKYHAFVYPSHGEGLGNAFIEALASGIHCFSYQNTVFPELKSLGLSFYMAPDRDVASLAEDLKEVWEARSPVNQGNVELCQNVFSVEAEMDALKGYLC